MRCKKCGYFNDSANVFCGGCGKKLVNDGRNNNLLLILLGILIAILIVIIVYFAAGIMRKESEAATENVKTTFSATIGEVGGTVYSIRGTGTGNIDTCEILPVPLGDSQSVESFCYYDGYVYYIVSTGGSSDYDCWLYRCKSDFTSVELLDTMLWGEKGSTPAIYFIIDNNMLYYTGMKQGEVTAFKLGEKVEKTTGVMPVYTVNYNGVTYRSDDSFGTEIHIYDDKVFFTDENHNLYKVVNGECEFIVSGGYLDGGFANGYLYYAEYDTGAAVAECKLCRIKPDGSERKVLDTHLPAGGGGPYFCR